MTQIFPTTGKIAILYIHIHICCLLRNDMEWMVAKGSGGEPRLSDDSGLCKISYILL